MMNNFDIQQKSIELKEIVSRYEKESFVGFFAYFIRQQPKYEDSNVFDLFRSKLKDFQYLIGLNFFNEKNGTEDFFLDEDILKNIANRVNEIKRAYSLNDFSFDQFDSDISYQKKAIIHEFTFTNHFHNGTLTYVEQDIERFIMTFKPFESIIKENFGFDIQFLIDIYKFSESYCRSKLKKDKVFTTSIEFKELAEKATLDKKTFNEYLHKMPDAIRTQFLDFVNCSHNFLKFSKSDYYDEFSQKDVDTFLNIFSCNSSDNHLYLYYSDENPLDLKPIIRLSDKEYLHVYQKQLPIAYYRFFYKYCTEKLNNEAKIQKHRGKVLEQKCFEIFNDFLSNEKQTFFYQNYLIDKHYEQDLLILSKGNAFIIEIKASKFREPLRSVDKAFQKINDDFKGNVQLGYNQCLRVKEKFNSHEKFPIYDANGKILHIIDPRKINNIFSIIVTLERLGPIQVDLGMLLEIPEDEEYPWSVCIDDLEIFLSTLKIKTKNHKQELIQYLLYRELLHERLICMDELDICAFYLSNKKLFAELSQQIDATFTMSTQNQNYFDDLYYQGVGLFKNEIFLDDKKNNNYTPNADKISAFPINTYSYPNND